MTGLAVTAVGVDQLATSCDAAGSRLANLQDVNQAAGAVVIAGAEIPHDTGALEATVAVVADRDGVDLVAGGPTAPYAGYVHARDPFLTRALSTREDAVLDVYTRHVEDVVESIQGA